MRLGVHFLRFDTKAHTNDCAFPKEHICVAVCEKGDFVGIFFLVLLMIIKLDFKRFNMLFFDSC